MNQEDRLELIAMLAQDDAWDAVVHIGRALLDCYFPSDVFTGESGDSGPQYIVALREALWRIDGPGWEIPPFRGTSVEDPAKAT